MIIGIYGKIERVEPTFVHIATNGLIYEVNVSLNTSNQIGKDETKLMVTQIIREDANLLYGFIDNNEKTMFDTLIKVNGIGPKASLAVCSTFTPSVFSDIIANKDVNMLKKVVGIGPKSASRILVELADFIVTDNHSSGMSDAVLALESLGFKKDAILKVLRGVSGDTPSLVKEGLKKLQRL